MGPKIIRTISAILMLAVGTLLTCTGAEQAIHHDPARAIAFDLVSAAAMFAFAWHLYRNTKTRSNCNIAVDRHQK